MDGLHYVIIFSLLSCASPASFTRRHLSQAPVTDPSTFTPGGSPFFPAYGSSSPPPPPPPAPLPPPAPTYATFPANISALVLPRSPKPHTTTRTLLIPAISAVLAVATSIGLALFLYGRWRGQNRNLKDFESKSVASSEQAPRPFPRNTTGNKLSVAASTSDVLYLGNVVTSESGFVKPESPEICPLPPLPARSFLQHNPESNPLTDEEEEEEENDDFYSPLASLAGQETGRQRNNPYSNCSPSSASDSPAMSPSVTISPPMSSTAPHWSTQNPQSPSPERRVRNNKRYGSSLRMFSLWNQNLGFPRISSASTSPERGMIRTPDAYARSSMYSSVSTTPDRFFRKVLESSPPRWNDFSRNVKSLFLSSTSASPARDFCINISESSRNLKSSWEIPELDSSEQGESAGVAPPPQRPPPAMPEPPPLVPPSQSFMVQKSGKKLSFSELPQSCWEATTERPKPKLKPLPWDKVRPRSCRKNTWDSLKFSSSNSSSKQRSLSCDLPMLNQEDRVLDPRKCQNIAFLLTTLKLTTDDIRQALRDGQYEVLGVELLENLSRMAPSEEEEKKLKTYSDDSVNKLAPSERFLKELLNVPFVFKRVDALLSVANFNSKVSHLKSSFGVIQAACVELRNSRILLKLIEVVLETGMKSGNAHDFKLEALLELIDIKLLDGRTTLLQSVVQKIIESEGIKVLQVVRELSSVLVDVKKSAEMDYGVLRSDMAKLYQGVQKVSEVLLLSEKNGPNEEQQWWKFRESMTRFLETAVEEIKKIETEDGSTLFGVKEMTNYFHGDSAKEEAQLLSVFVIVRDFLSILDGVCKDMEVTRE
ncbi:hypothetical protein EUTSA_v10020077mg [Eutrema salsugineum]|uniref:Formin-like protein n=1 Tax=Eutrema salsugineum TaxID=72664 RepID=V4LZI4_EUTSA|nr:formin-like protein 10 [Eutrema salsugineum]ESQ49279.1 hypothetical protein EUTSA_v10020077mg [Eutrema salsugineum]